MIVRRMALPGTATIVLAQTQRLMILDTSLSRDQAALAIQGLLPDCHPDVADHWLDQAFERTSGVALTRLSAGVAGAATA